MDQRQRAEQVLAELQSMKEAAAGKLLAACLKIKKRLRLEIQFLKKPTSKTNRSSSNLPYLYGVVETLKSSQDVQQVITYWRKYNIRIDVICDGGKTWKKVVAWDPQSLHLSWRGIGPPGVKNVSVSLHQHLLAARMESTQSPPRVVCVFTEGVTEKLAEYLTRAGVVVDGERVPASEHARRRVESFTDSECSSDDSDGEEEKGCVEVKTSDIQRLEESQTYWEYDPDLSECEEEITDSVEESSAEEAFSGELTKIVAMPTDEKIFLDVTSLVIYVSDVCNGGATFNFKDTTMAEQAEQERTTPVKPILDEYFDNRLLLTCEAALDNYRKFMAMLGGEEEQSRATELMKRLTVVPDDMTNRFRALKEHGKIKERSKTIFGTADKMRCNILTSNESFIRAAAAQGVAVSAIVHQPRHLSEVRRLDEIDDRQ